MKKRRLRSDIFLFFAIVCLGIILFGSLFGQAGGTEPGVTVMTFNIRYNNQNDLQNAWPNRKSLVVSTLRLSKTGHYGATQSFNEFNIELDPGNTIDFIFVRDVKSVLRHGIIAELWDGKFVSDHYPVIAEVVVR